ncbi:MAG: ATP-binding cassette domain-containing protein [bacterium]
MIRTRGLKVSRGGEPVLNGVDLEVEAGRITTIIGESGCGKSTLLRAVMRLIPVDGGEIWIEGRLINDLPEAKMDEVRKRMGMVFQEGALFDSMTVEENVAFPLRRHTRMSRGEISRVVGERLEAVGLTDARKKMPDQLSGGMKRRVAVARALALGPKILLYDEPTTGLDPILTATILELILKMRERYGTTTIVVTHDMRSAMKISDRIAMIHGGRIVEEGSVERIKSGSSPLMERFLQTDLDEGKVRHG